MGTAASGLSEAVPQRLHTPIFSQAAGSNAYLADIDRQAQERFERLIEGMKQAQGITKRLKAENALEWTGRLNNIRACAREIVQAIILLDF